MKWSPKCLEIAKNRGYSLIGIIIDNKNQKGGRIESTFACSKDDMERLHKLWLEIIAKK